MVSLSVALISAAFSLSLQWSPAVFRKFILLVANEIYKGNVRISKVKILPRDDKKKNELFIRKVLSLKEVVLIFTKLQLEKTSMENRVNQIPYNYEWTPVEML